MSDLPLLDAGDGGRRMFRVTAPSGFGLAITIAADAASACAHTRHVYAIAGHDPGEPRATDVGHADRTEVTQWGLTDRA